MSDRKQETDGRDHAAEDLRATSDAVQDDLRRLAAIEAEKAARDTDDPAIDQLSEEAVKVAERIRTETLVEREIGKELR